MEKREIKFRIFHQRWNEFRYWGFIDGVFIGPPTGTFSIPECLELSQQFTGLKDKNGKDVFEGDIVSGNHKDNFVIESINGGLQMYNIRYYGQKNNHIIADATCSLQTKAWLENSVIIGNIFKSPELLKTEVK